MGRDKDTCRAKLVIQGINIKFELDLSESESESVATGQYSDSLDHALQAQAV